MNIKYNTEINKNDWQYVLDNSFQANIFHSVEYFQTLHSDGHKIIYLCCYDDDKPIGIITGVFNNIGYHKGLIEIGTKSGGYPVFIDEYEKKKDAELIKNNFIKYFASQYIKDNNFCFYPCFNMENCIFENSEYLCKKQYDQTVMLDMTPDINELWMGLNQKCRNVVRYAQKKEVKAKIVNKYEYLELFYKFYKELRERLCTQYMSFEEIKSRFDMLISNNLGDLWAAFSDETPLAYAFIWKYKKNINFVYGSSDPLTLSLKPNNLIQWDIIKYYKEHGYELYNMWGVRNMNFSEDCLNKQNRKIEGYGKFKLSFGSELKDIVRYFRI